MEMYFIFGVMISFFIFGNLGIHLFYKKKHKKFLDSLKGKNFTLIKNLNMEMESSGKLGSSYQFNKSHVVILENEIFLLLFSKPFKQAQPILQISNSNIVYDNISKKISFDSKFRVQGKLRIQGTFGKGITSGKYKIFLDFNKSNFDLNSILI
ncbi:hypothetical protein [Chryseobacterium chendengshani]|uniref:hypothetical protein n=1 Tax=Chryseobacterium sp. LJ756 TaxID=2864113 RepID=UPI001C6446D1|nr:hypothetical protein [Chryseobacterium sp. LJ756]MBW7674572.1 hypothetical protein [Chryseobacterium sp. LJ756]